MNLHLPTLTSASWTLTAFRDSLATELNRDSRAGSIRLYFYAVTASGWKAVRKDFRRWMRNSDQGSVTAYVGTDHAITEAEGLRVMQRDGVQVRLMTNYNGIFHPKLVWLQSVSHHLLWIGSNNLTRDGLLNNIEFATFLRSSGVPPELEQWAEEVHRGSTECTEDLITEYEAEREDYGRRRVDVGTFTWSRREQGTVSPTRSRKRHKQRGDLLSAVRTGDLIVEIMPRETGTGGNQIQLPMRAVTAFLGMPDRIGASRVIQLTPSWINDPRPLTVTIYRNSTARLVIRELDYRDRPCVMVFRRRRHGVISFEIVARSVHPTRYQSLLRRCAGPTRSGSRRWSIIGS
jgi:hypothetical protein